MLIDVPVPYAEAGDLIDAQHSLTVLYNGQPVDHVVEVNCPEGWLIKYIHPFVIGLDGSIQTERLEGEVRCFYTKDVTNAAK